VLVLAAFLLAQPINVLFILRNHQPWHIDLDIGELVLAWVRMHAVSNYLKVPLIIKPSRQRRWTARAGGLCLRGR
jgi:alpha-amylase/alpha-mannosidase (GH57 family)